MRKKPRREVPFKVAAERLKEARDEKERLQRIVEDSEGVEQHLRELDSRHADYEEAVDAAIRQREALERLAAQAAIRNAAAEEVDRARQEVSRIQTIASEVDAAERSIADLAHAMEMAEEAVRTAQARRTEADAAFEAAQEAARATASEAGLKDTVARQHLELRKAAAAHASSEAQQQIDAAAAAQRLLSAATAAELEHRTQQRQGENTRAMLDAAAAKERLAVEQLRRIDLLERALDARNADQRAAAAQAEVDELAALEARREVAVNERETLAKRRAAIIVPPAGAVGPMRRLGTDLAAARGALNVGLVVTVTPNRPIDIRVTTDGTAADPAVPGAALEVEANAAVDLDIGDVATVRIRGGRRAAQRNVQALEARWSREVAPHLAAAEVTDLEGLSAKIAEAQELDISVRGRDTELESLEVRIATLGGAAQKLGEARDRAIASRGELGDVPIETFASELAALGAEPTDALRARRQQGSRELELARAAATQAATADTLAQERARNSQVALNAAAAARDEALAGFAHGVAATLAAAQAALAAASQEQEKAAVELISLESAIAERRQQAEAAVRDARAAAEQARVTLEAAQAEHRKALADHAAQGGLLAGLRRQRDAEDLAAAETRLRAATDRLADLPVPERTVTEAEISAAQNAETVARSGLQATQREIERTRGALEQVGGAVARERLRDAIEAFDLAARQEREIEAEYEAWLLLLEQMRDADAAQASNLGQALAPAIASRFKQLTERRYDNVQLTAELGTEGIVAAGAVRATGRISVGTREQLSTLYRLALAEYLGTTVVLDDQLVQSDGTRMDWFRSLLAEKARLFQIVVFTCRPEDYLAANAMVPKGKSIQKDTEGGFVRAIDLGRALRRR